MLKIRQKDCTDPVSVFFARACAEAIFRLHEYATQMVWTDNISRLIEDQFKIFPGRGYGIKQFEESILKNISTGEAKPSASDSEPYSKPTRISTVPYFHPPTMVQIKNYASDLLAKDQTGIPATSVAEQVNSALGGDQRKMTSMGIGAVAPVSLPGAGLSDLFSEDDEEAHTTKITHPVEQAAAIADTISGVAEPVQIPQTSVPVSDDMDPIIEVQYPGDLLGASRNEQPEEESVSIRSTQGSLPEIEVGYVHLREIFDPSLTGVREPAREPSVPKVAAPLPEPIPPPVAVARKYELPVVTAPVVRPPAPPAEPEALAVQEQTVAAAPASAPPQEPKSLPPVTPPQTAGFQDVSSFRFDTTAKLPTQEQVTAMPDLKKIAEKVLGTAKTEQLAQIVQLPVAPTHAPVSMPSLVSTISPASAKASPLSLVKPVTPAAHPAPAAKLKSIRSSVPSSAAAPAPAPAPAPKIFATLKVASVPANSSATAKVSAIREIKVVSSPPRKIYDHELNDDAPAEEIPKKSNWVRNALGALAGAAVVVVAAMGIRSANSQKAKPGPSANNSNTASLVVSASASPSAPTAVVKSIPSPQITSIPTPQVTSTPAPAPTPAPTIMVVPEKNPVFGFDNTSAKFAALKKLFRDQQMYGFETALDFAARKTILEKTGNEVPTRIDLYRAFLLSALETHNRAGTLHQYFEIRLRNLDYELSREKDSKNAATLFSGSARDEDRRLFEAIPNPVIKAEPVNVAGCAVETDPQKNHAFARFVAQMPKAYPAFYREFQKAVKDSVTHPCNCNEVVDCVFNRASDYSKVAKENDSSNNSLAIADRYRELTNNGIANEVGDIFYTTREVKGQGPKGDSIKPFGNDPATTPAPANGTDLPVKPEHSFNDSETEWFADGEIMTARHVKEEAENRAHVLRYSEWFPDEVLPQRPSIVARATAYAKKVATGERTFEEIEQKELQKATPMKSFLRNLFLG